MKSRMQIVHKGIRYFNIIKGQQDSAPYHTSIPHACQTISETRDMWPPNSPDCNPLDYYIWGEVEQETDKTPCNTKDELKARIMTTFTIIYTRKTAQNSCRGFRSRLEALVEASGDIIEYLYYLAFQDICL